MAYVDLNPVRAGIAPTPEQSEFTSLRYRIKNNQTDKKIQPLNHSRKRLDLLLSEYLELVDETGRSLRDDKPGYKMEKALPILARLRIKPSGYLYAMQNLSYLFGRAVGSVDQLSDLSEILNLRWVKGHASARRVFR